MMLRREDCEADEEMMERMRDAREAETQRRRHGKERARKGKAGAKVCAPVARGRWEAIALAKTLAGGQCARLPNSHPHPLSSKVFASEPIGMHHYAIIKAVRLFCNYPLRHLQ